MNVFAQFGAGHSQAALPPFLAQLPDSFWMPAQGSTVASEVDNVFFVIYWISAFFFAIIVGLMVLFALRYRRRREGEDVARTASHSVALEVTWTAIPVIVSAILFVVGFKGYMNLSTPPRNSYEISVTAQKWQWFFTYPNGYVTSELHIPEDLPVKLTMTSEDVIHSLWIPAFRVKKDVVPGRYTRTWFEATDPGTYPLLCTEYCGAGHSDMLTVVTVHASGRFETWLEQAANLYDTMPPAEAGEMLVQRKGCVQCHSLTGAAGIGPTFVDVYGHTITTKDGRQVLADDNYIRESILDPMASIVAGFEPVMPTFAGKIKDKEITYIIAYLKSVSSHGGTDGEAAADSTGEATDEASATEVH